MVVVVGCKAGSVEMGWSFSEGYLDGVQGLQRPIYKQHVLAIDVIVRGVFHHSDIICA